MASFNLTDSVDCVISSIFLCSFVKSVEPKLWISTKRMDLLAYVWYTNLGYSLYKYLLNMYYGPCSAISKKDLLVRLYSVLMKLTF